MPRPKWEEITKYAISEYQKARQNVSPVKGPTRNAVGQTSSPVRRFDMKQVKLGPDGNRMQEELGEVEPQFMRDFQDPKPQPHQVIDTVNELGKPYNFPIPVQQQFLAEKL